MARTDDPQGFDPHPGDPWHPGWEPPVEDDDSEPAEPTEAPADSSVDNVYSALRDLDDEPGDGVETDAGEAPDGEEPASLVVADVEPIQISGSFESSTPIAVDWETRNVEEERRLEAAAGVFAGRELRSAESELEADLEAEETDDEAAEEERMASQVEHAHGEWVGEEIRGLEADLLSGEAEGIEIAAEDEATRRDDQIEMAWSGEAAEASRGAEAAFAEFEDFREGVEEAVEEERRSAEVEDAERGWVDEEMRAHEEGLAEGVVAAEEDAGGAEELRWSDQVERARGDVAGAAFAAHEEGLAADERLLERAAQLEEEERRSVEAAGAEEQWVGEEMHALEGDLSSAADSQSQARLDAEEVRAHGAIEKARAAEAASAAGDTEATHREFEGFRAGVEAAAEAERRRAGVAAAEQDEFEVSISALTEELAASEDVTDDADAAHEAARAGAQIEYAASDAAADEAGSFQAELKSSEARDALTASTDEAVRAGRQIEEQASQEFAETMRVAGLELEADAAAGNDAEEATETERREDQVGREAAVAEQAAAVVADERFRVEESRMRFAADVDERFALEAELQRASIAASSSEGVAEVAEGPGEPQVGMPQSRGGWLQRLFGRVRARQAGVQVTQSAGADESEEPVGDERRDPQIVPADIGRRWEDVPIEALGPDPDDTEDVAATGPAAATDEPGREIASEDADAALSFPQEDTDAEEIIDADQHVADEDAEVTGGEPGDDIAEPSHTAVDDAGADVPAGVDVEPAADVVDGTVAEAGEQDDAAVGEVPDEVVGEGTEAADESAAEAHEAPAISVAPDTGVEAGDETSDEHVPVATDGTLFGDNEVGSDEWEDPLTAAGFDEEAEVRDVEAPEVVETVPAAEHDAPDDIPDFAAFTSDHYVQATTEEYAGLAEAVAKAAAEDTGERAAVAAPIPGLDSGLVGLEDVMAEAAPADAEAPILRRSDLAVRIGTAVVLLAVFLGSMLNELSLGLLLLVVLFIAVSEFYTVLLRNGHRPVALFGFLGTLGAFVGTWLWGVGAIPVSIALTLVLSALMIGAAPQAPRAQMNLALTVAVMSWVGGLGAFAFAFLESEHYRWLISAAVVTTAVMDVVQYFVGKRIGRHAMAPFVSPKKTIEGLAGGMVAAVVTGLVFGSFEPFTMVSGLALGAVVAVVSPFGDLAVSVAKRALGVKDMGGVLPGHGGVLDRIDAMIIVLPAAWIVFRASGLL